MPKFRVHADEELEAIDADYGIIEHELTTEAQKAVDEIAGILPWGKGGIRVVMVRSADGYLGKWRSETENEPIIMLDPAAIIKSAKKYGVDLYTAVASTIWHELGHALIAYAEMVGVELALLPSVEEEEEWAEEMAHSFWSVGSVGARMETILKALGGEE